MPQPPPPVYNIDDVVREIRKTNLLMQTNNEFLEDILAKVSQILNVIAVEANAPPQYTGPTDINDLVVDVGRQLEGFDPDGDAITWSIDPADASRATVSPGGILTMTTAYQGPITVWMDDGKETKRDSKS